MVKVYLAGPFFDKHGFEARRVAQVKALLECNATVDAVFSPKDETDQDPDIQKLTPMSLEWRQRVFQCDLDGIKGADVLVVIADSETNLNGSDDGTTFEVGYWHARNEWQRAPQSLPPLPVVVVAQVTERLNLMLAEATTYFTDTPLDLRDLDFAHIPVRAYHGAVI
ncbi:nucleoside 2-deoxyribosyltransferase [Lapidilactobacillus bayanensis]|uniref:nucleoside 2-deoxyribosyltransferase n=1 Tax=Lapidilactobacillus bayanensis TaxID=2485998 RepID=UPI000F790033|nr:nucleoside 2-deoxyribosyltransferase [Lapidilactobacillus bayanensis]